MRVQRVDTYFPWIVKKISMKWFVWFAWIHYWLAGCAHYPVVMCFTSYASIAGNSNSEFGQKFEGKNIFLKLFWIYFSSHCPVCRSNSLRHLIFPDFQDVLNALEEICHDANVANEAMDSLRQHYEWVIRRFLRQNRLLLMMIRTGRNRRHFRRGRRFNVGRRARF